MYRDVQKVPYIRMLDSDWLIAVIFFLQIQALHCEFAEFLLHVGGCICIRFNFFSWYLQYRICRFYPSPNACNKICKTLSVVRFMQCHSVELNRYIMLGPENDKQKVLFI
jgi:hypothetical protein